jgi:low temperature requirement protein LtrA
VDEPRSYEDDDHRVTPLELFFDLVFVFAITQVTTYFADHLSWAGLAEGLLVLAALWWAWAAYAWLTNTVDADEGWTRIAMLAAMAAMLIVSLAVPRAWGEDAVIFGLAYFLVRVLHIALYAISVKGDSDLRRAVLRMTPSATLGPLLIVLAGFLDGGAQLALWVVALLLDYLGVLVGRGAGWRVSAEHFAERHALIVIIALGESIVALGIGARAFELDLGVVVGATLGFVVVASLWWLYFDVFAIFGRMRLERSSGADQATFARDGYSYLHMPMVAGIVLFALALKKTLEHVDEPLGTIPAAALCAGLALYLLAQCAFMLRASGRLFRRRFLGGLVLLMLLPLVLEVPALASLALAAATCVSVVAFEAIRHREHRAHVRHPELAAPVNR